MRKFQDFSVTQILREITFEESRSSKSAIYAILWPLNLVKLLKVQPSKSAKINKNLTSEPLNFVKMTDFAKFYFT